MKKLNDIIPGDFIKDGIFHLKKLRAAGNFGYNLDLMDSSGQATAYLLPETFKEEYYSYIGKAIKIDGFVDFQNAKPVIKITKISTATAGEYDSCELVKALSQEEQQALISTLQELINCVKHKGYKALLKFIFNTSTIKKLSTLPATLNADASFCGGLLHKTVVVTKSAYVQAQLLDQCRVSLYNDIPETDYELLITAGLLHLMGKIREYTDEFPFKKTEIGFLQGTHEITMQTICACEKKLSEDEQITDLEHARLSSVILALYTEKGMRIISREGLMLNNAQNLYELQDKQLIAQQEVAGLSTDAAFVYNVKYGGYVENFNLKKEVN